MIFTIFRLKIFRKEKVQFSSRSCPFPENARDAEHCWRLVRYIRGMAPLLGSPQLAGSSHAVCLILLTFF